MTRSCVAIVLAGGRSRRFGSDKLDARIDGSTLLDLVVGGLPPDAEVIVVGPPRPTSTAVRFVREDPPDGGPAAALVAGLIEGLRGPASVFVTVPGDAPGSGHAVTALLVALQDRAGDAVVATDDRGVEQPLQLALSRTVAQSLVHLAGPTGGAGQSARALLAQLDPPAAPVLVVPVALYDIDTPDDLACWLGRDQLPQRSALNSGRCP